MTDETRTAHSTTQAFGLTLILVALLVMTVLSVVLFGAGDAVFPAVVAIVVGVALYLVRRFDTTWTRILGMVITVAAFVTTFFLAFGVLQPFSPIEFIVSLMYVLGIVLALVGGIMALVAGRKDKAGPTTGETRLRTATLGLIGVAAVISIVGFFVTKSSVSAAEAAGATSVEMANFEFDPYTSSATAGENLLVANTDAFAHDFTLEEFGIYVYVGPGSEALVDLSAAAPGTYDYFCSLHSDGTEGMTGTITIES